MTNLVLLAFILRATVCGDIELQCEQDSAGNWEWQPSSDDIEIVVPSMRRGSCLIKILYIFLVAS